MTGPVAGPGASPVPGPAPDPRPVGFRSAVELSKDEAFELCDLLWRAERALQARGWQVLGDTAGRWVDTIERRMTATGPD